MPPSVHEEWQRRHPGELSYDAKRDAWSQNNPGQSYDQYEIQQRIAMGSHPEAWDPSQYRVQSSNPNWREEAARKEEDFQKYAPYGRNANGMAWHLGDRATWNGAPIGQQGQIPSAQANARATRSNSEGVTPMSFQRVIDPRPIETMEPWEKYWSPEYRLMPSLRPMLEAASQEFYGMRPGDPKAFLGAGAPAPQQPSPGQALPPRPATQPLQTYQGPPPVKPQGQQPSPQQTPEFTPYGSWGGSFMGWGQQPSPRQTRGDGSPVGNPWGE